jgi:cation diffusion facilitator CzcD-associated flavoprotein CzcO
MTDTTETVIVGGGQAGLAVSYYLSRHGRDHVVLEQSDRPDNSWRNHRRIRRAPPPTAGSAPISAAPEVWLCWAELKKKMNRT